MKTFILEAIFAAIAGLAYAYFVMSKFDSPNLVIYIGLGLVCAVTARITNLAIKKFGNSAEK